VGSVPGGFAVTFGGGSVRYAAGVHARNPWMIRGFQRAAAERPRRIAEAAKRLENV
jgi:hypothetical protein